MDRILLAGLLSAIVSAAAADPSAQPACHGAGFPAAKELAFDPHDETISEGLNIALQMGLTPATFPADDIAKIAKPCRRLDFEAAGLTYSLYGTDDALPYRWASTPTRPGEVAYTAAMPGPGPALDWYLKNGRNSTSAQFSTGTETLVVLAITAGDTREIFRFYDKTPADAVLAADMCAALSGELPVVATLTEGSGTADLSHLRDKPSGKPSSCRTPR
jgi:hypothetical protein